MKDTRVWFGNVHRRAYARFHLPAIDFRLHGRALCGAQIFHKSPSAARGQRDGAKTTRHDVSRVNDETGERENVERFGAYERADFVARYPDRRCTGCDIYYSRGAKVWRD